MEEIIIIPESLQLVKMTDEEYFSEKYKDYISNSRLGYLDPDNDGSIEKYLKGFEEKYSESFELGSAIHAILLQPESHVISKYDKPSGKLGVFVENVFRLRRKGFTLINAINQAKVESDYYKDSLTSTRLKTAIRKSLRYYLDRLKNDEIVIDKKIIYLSSTLKEKFNLCINSLNSNKSLLKKLRPDSLFFPCEIFNEYAILGEIKVVIGDSSTILKIKAKLDNFTIDHEIQQITLNDLKSTGKPVSYFMGNNITEYDEHGNKKIVWKNGSFQTYKYYRQMGFYLWLLNAYLSYTYNYKYKLNANMLLVETMPDYNTKVCKVGNDYINKGLVEFKKLILILAKWMINNTST